MQRKAILLTTRPSNDEMEELIFALGADLVGMVLQKRLQPDPQLFLGKGKTEEARELVRAAKADLVIINGSLKPIQIFNHQRFFEEDGGGPVEVYDRTRLILEIFRERARSPEARLQVELAQLHYEMPLVKEAIHAQRRGERQAAMFGGGEYEVNQYHDMMKKRMSRIRRDLEKMRRERGLRRKHRRRGGFHLVSLAGYTNAGKSSLLNAMSEQNVLAENRYFSTLGTKTARARSDRREILITDTVGFIEDLPPWMVEAFHSTLEEIALADVILLVLDASDPASEMARRLRSSLRILWEFDGEPRVRSAAAFDLDGAGSERVPASRKETRGEDDGEIADALAADARAASGSGSRLLVPMRKGLAPILVALNKVDRLAPDELAAKRAFLEAEGLLDPERTVAVSAHTGDGLQELYERLYDLIPDYDEYEVAIPPTPEAEGFIAWAHDHADVLDLTRGNEVHLHFEAKRSLRLTIREKLAAIRATPLREVIREAAEPEGAADPDAPLDGDGPAEDGASGDATSAEAATSERSPRLGEAGGSAGAASGEDRTAASNEDQTAAPGEDQTAASDEDRTVARGEDRTSASDER